MILSHVLRIPRNRLHLEPHREITHYEERVVDGHVQRRVMRVPLQYTTGECGFMSLTLKVRPGVFIPRPETEVLVEALMERIEAASRRPGMVLALGTGSGAIGLSLAAHFRAGLVVATDISQLAVEIARGNAIMNSVDHLARFVVGDGLGFLRAAPGVAGAGEFDVVACNPPYVRSAEIEELEPEVRDYEPRVALDGGPSGLDFIEGILPGIPSILVRGGIAGVEIGETQAEQVTAIFRRTGFQNIEVIEDLNGKDRVVIGRRA